MDPVIQNGFVNIGAAALLYLGAGFAGIVVIGGAAIGAFKALDLFHDFTARRSGGARGVAAWHDRGGR